MKLKLLRHFNTTLNKEKFIYDFRTISVILVLSVLSTIIGTLIKSFEILGIR